MFAQIDQIIENTMETIGTFIFNYLLCEIG